VCNDQNIAATPEELFRWAVDQRLSYGPGRGLGVELDGRWHYMATNGPGRLGMDGSPGFHCSSWTNFVLAYFTGVSPEHYTHRGNMPSLFDLCRRQGVWVWNPVRGGKPVFARPVDILCYGGACTELDFGTYRELVEGDLGGFDLVVLGESSLRGGKWKWWHHTAAVARDASGRAIRCAADGYKGAKGYSRTPMDIETLDEAALRRTDKVRRIKAFGVRIVPPAWPLAVE
jgi:hypothetical protein